MFRVGQKVVCVDARGAHHLTERHIYTIAKVYPEREVFWRGKMRRQCGILLIESVPNPGDRNFAPQRFRPTIEKKTDISIFTAMLKTKQKDLVTD